MPRQTLALVLLALGAALAGCDAESPEKAAARRSARAAVCVADELAIAAQARVRELEGMLGEMEATGSPMAAPLRSSLAFARAYAAHAELRHQGLARVDSALHAAGAADSARHAEAARAASPMAAGAGSVESNAAEKWMEDFRAARANPDHPCNLPAERR